MIAYADLIREAFPGWEPVREIGQGMSGITFLVCRKDFPEMASVVKIIEVPDDEEEPERLRN